MWKRAMRVVGAAVLGTVVGSVGMCCAHVEKPAPAWSITFPVPEGAETSPDLACRRDGLQLTCYNYVPFTRHMIQRELRARAQQEAQSPTSL